MNNLENLVYNMALAAFAKEAMGLSIPTSMGATPNPNGVALVPPKMPSLPMPTVGAIAPPSPATPKV